MQEIQKFEDSVKKGLIDCGINLAEELNLGAAVSGGADSISLLFSLKSLLPENIKLFVITVNHNLRPEEETCGDASYVEECCRKLNVTCYRKDIPRGKITELSVQRNMGIEEAARVLRYESFEEFILKFNIKYLCLAHNRNDQVETILMRFLSGGGCEALSGIPQKRDKFVRPLLNIQRKDIENYLALKNISFKTDKTNFDTSMTRNRIRNKLIPFLNENFNGFDNALMNLKTKMSDDEFFIESSELMDYEKIILNKKDDEIILSFEEFCKLPSAIRRRILYRCIDETGASKRVPYSFVEELLKVQFSREVKYKKESSGIEIVIDKGSINIHKKVLEATEYGFSDIISTEGLYEILSWKINVKLTDRGVCLTENISGKEIVIDNLTLPFIIRSRQTGDEIKTVDGSMKNISKIFKDWKVSDDKDSIILVEEINKAKPEIKCIWGSVLGYKDWIVR